MTEFAVHCAGLLLLLHLIPFVFSFASLFYLLGLDLTHKDRISADSDGMYCTPGGEDGEGEATIMALLWMIYWLSMVENTKRVLDMIICIKTTAS